MRCTDTAPVLIQLSFLAFALTTMSNCLYLQHLLLWNSTYSDSQSMPCTLKQSFVSSMKTSGHTAGLSLPFLCIYTLQLVFIVSTSLNYQLSQNVLHLVLGNGPYSDSYVVIVEIWHQICLFIDHWQHIFLFSSFILSLFIICSYWLFIPICVTIDYWHHLLHQTTTYRTCYDFYVGISQI